MKLSSKHIHFDKAPTAIRAVANPETLVAEQAKAEGYQLAKMEAMEFQKKLFLEMNDKYVQMMQAVEKRIPSLVCSLTKRVFDGLELEEEKVKGVIDSVLKENAPEGESLTVKVSPGDFEKIKGYEADFEKSYSGMQFQVDERLGSGDCLVESRFGVIDGRVDTKLSQAEQQIS